MASNMVDLITPSFGSHMRDRRERLGLSLRALENHVPISRSRLSAYETGKALPDKDIGALFDAALNADGELIAILSTTHIASAEALEFSNAVPEAVRIAARLWNADVEGIRTVRKARFDASAYLKPAMRALVPPTESPRGGGMGDVDQPDGVAAARQHDQQRLARAQ
jgi:transcriptional regulator with XRE-family HTH domain